MSNRRWLDIAEYVSFSGSVLGLIASSISQQVIFASAPLSFCILLNLISRRRLDQQTSGTILPALDDLKQQATKEKQALLALRHHVMSMPRPDDLSALKRAAIQADRQVSVQAMDRITQLQTQLESRLVPLEALDLKTTQEDLNQLQSRYSSLQESLAELTEQLESVPTPARVEHLEGAIANLISESSQLHTQLQDLINQPPIDLVPLQNQIHQLNQQVSSLPPPFNPKNLENKLKILTQEMEKSIQAMAVLVSKQELSVVQSEVDRLQQRQQSLSQSLKPVRESIDTAQSQLRDLHQQLQDRTELQVVEELRRGLAKIIPSVTTLEYRFKTIPKEEDLAELRQEMQLSSQDLHQQIVAMHQATRTLNHEQGELHQQVEEIQQATTTLNQGQQSILERLDQVVQLAPVPEILPIQVEVLAARVEAIEGRVEDMQMYGQTYQNGNGARPTPVKEDNAVSLASSSSSQEIDALPDLSTPVVVETPGLRPANRALLEEVLASVQFSLIVTRSWLENCQVDSLLVKALAVALERGIQIDVIWGPVADGTTAHPARRIRQDEKTGQNAGPQLLLALYPLRQQYPQQLNLKGLGTQEQLLVCDRTTASLVRDPISDSTGDHEVGLQTSDPEIIHHLLLNFDDASLDLQDAMAYFLRAAARYELGDIQGALSDYSQGLQLQPQDDVAYNNRGVVYYQLGGRERAVADFDQALALNPANGAAYYNRGIARTDLGDRQGAIEDYTQAIHLSFDDDTLYNNRGLVYSKLGNYLQAQKDYTEAICRNASNAIAYNNRGLVRSRLGDKKGAVTDYTVALKLNPEDDSVYFNRGAVRASLEDYRGAIADYSEAIRINPEFVNAYNNRGFVHQKLGDKQAAIADFDRALQINPNFANAYNNRGTTRSKLKDFEGAIQDFDRALQINPNFANAYNNRGTAQSKLKDFTGAIKDFNRALQINPNFANAYNNRGLARAELGDGAGALADLRQAANLFRTQGDEASSQQALVTLSKLQPEPVAEG